MVCRCDNGSYLHKSVLVLLFSTLLVHLVWGYFCIFAAPKENKSNKKYGKVRQQEQRQPQIRAAFNG